MLNLHQLQVRFKCSRTHSVVFGHSLYISASQTQRLCRMVHDCRIDLSKPERRVHLVRSRLHLLLLKLLQLLIGQAVLLLMLLTLLLLLLSVRFCQRLLSTLLHPLSLGLNHLLLLRGHRWRRAIPDGTGCADRNILLTLLSDRYLLRCHCPDELGTAAIP